MNLPLAPTLLPPRLLLLPLFRLREEPLEAIQPNQVLLQFLAAPINPADINMVRAKCAVRASTARRCQSPQLSSRMFSPAFCLLLLLFICADRVRLQHPASSAGHRRQ